MMELVAILGSGIILLLVPISLHLGRIANVLEAAERRCKESS